MDEQISTYRPELSLVIPVYNEVESLPKLLLEIHEALDPTGIEYEMIFVDDGSKDGSYDLLYKAQQSDDRIVIVRFRRNFGQTAGFSAGFDHARGDIIVTLDADGQNPPADIPSLVNKLKESDYDVVNGWRENRQDGLILRKIPSKIANKIIANSTGVKLRDRGCSLRAFRKPVVNELHLYGEMHRFIPEMISNAGFKLTEVPVSHRAREAGSSKYGISRTFRVVLDLFTVLFLRNFADRPMRLFGGLGITSGLIGALMFLYLFGLKFWAGITDGFSGFQSMSIGSRPLLLVAVLLIMMAVQFLTMGLLAELLVRVYYEGQNKSVYQLRNVARVK